MIHLTGRIALAAALVALPTLSFAQAMPTDTVAPAPLGTRLRLLVPSLPADEAHIVGPLSAMDATEDHGATLTIETERGARTVPCSMIQAIEREGGRHASYSGRATQLVIGAGLGALLANALAVEGTRTDDLGHELPARTGRRISIGATAGLAMAAVLGRDQSLWRPTSVPGCTTRR